MVHHHSEPMLANPAFSPKKEKTPWRGELLFFQPDLHLCQYQAICASQARPKLATQY